MEPRIQYAQTKDGVSIAFATPGVRMSLAWTPAVGVNHSGLVWQWPEYPITPPVSISTYVRGTFLTCLMDPTRRYVSMLLRTNEGMHDAEHKRHEHERCEAR